MKLDTTQHYVRSLPDITEEPLQTFFDWAKLLNVGSRERLYGQMLDAYTGQARIAQDIAVSREVIAAIEQDILAKEVLYRRTTHTVDLVPTFFANLPKQMAIKFHEGFMGTKVSTLVHKGLRIAPPQLLTKVPENHRLKHGFGPAIGKFPPTENSTFPSPGAVSAALSVASDDEQNTKEGEDDGNTSQEEEEPDQPDQPDEEQILEWYRSIRDLQAKMEAYQNGTRPQGGKDAVPFLKRQIISVRYSIKGAGLNPDIPPADRDDDLAENATEDTETD